MDAEQLVSSQDRRKRSLTELMELVAIPSISSLPEHSGDVDAAARWAKARLNRAGFEHVELLRAGPRPVVYGDWLNAGDARPTVMIYGHLDVQPVDPLDLWESQPFEPVVRDGRLYGRGASDDKGNLLAPVLACEALLETDGALPINVKVILEGEEEIGSPNLASFIESQRERLSCDWVISADGSQWSETEPELLLSLRGLCALQVDVTTASHDLHSGQYGGTVRNPIQALSEILASLHDEDGRIAVDGFYDHVLDYDRNARDEIARVPFSESDFVAEVGATAVVGEVGYSTREREWIRPTLEINGIWGGFQGEGIKTVLPAEAHAKISCRLVADQDPKTILSALRDQVSRNAPAGVTVGFTEIASHAWPYNLGADHRGVAAARSVLETLYGTSPYLVRTGGTIPLCALMKQQLDAETVSFSFALHDDRAHSPNEFFRIASFERAQVAYVRLLQELGMTG